MNDLDLCLEVVIKVMSTIAWHSTLNISEAVRDRGFFQMTTNMKWHMGHQIVTWPMTSHDPRMCCEAVRSAILSTDWLLVVIFLSFLARESIIARRCYRPSVCPSVRLSHGWISQKRLKLGLWNFHHTVAPYTSILCRVIFVQKFQQVLLSGGDQQWRGGKTSQF